jgi:hypothetical protein
MTIFPMIGGGGKSLDVPDRSGIRERERERERSKFSLFLNSSVTGRQGGQIYENLHQGANYVDKHFVVGWLGWVGFVGCMALGRSARKFLTN